MIVGRRADGTGRKRRGTCRATRTAPCKQTKFLVRVAERVGALFGTFIALVLGNQKEGPVHLELPTNNPSQRLAKMLVIDGRAISE